MARRTRQHWSTTSAASIISMFISTRFRQYWKTLAILAGSSDVYHSVSTRNDQRGVL